MNKKEDMITLPGRKYWERLYGKIQIDLTNLKGKKIINIIPIRGKARCFAVMGFNDGTHTEAYFDTDEKEIIREKTLEQFHKLWSKAVRTKGYDKKEWQKLTDYLKEFQIELS